MNRFLRLLRPISASIDALCNVKHRTNLGYKREKNPSIYKSTFKVSVRQISSVNKFGENDRDSLYDRFSILGFLAPIFAFSITKLVAGENVVSYAACSRVRGFLPTYRLLTAATHSIPIV